MARLELSFDIGTVELSRIEDAFATAYHYEELINGEANAETKAEFLKRHIAEYIRDISYFAGIPRRRSVGSAR